MGTGQHNRYLDMGMVNGFRIVLFEEVNTNKARLVPYGAFASLGGRKLHLQDKIVSTGVNTSADGISTGPA